METVLLIFRVCIILCAGLLMANGISLNEKNSVLVDHKNIGEAILRIGNLLIAAVYMGMSLLIVTLVVLL